MSESLPVDIEALRDWIGREESATDIITPSLVHRFETLFDSDRPEPEPGPEPGDVAPRLLHWCLAQPAVPSAGLGPDGHPARGGFLPPVPLPRRMWAGGELAFDGDLRVGDAVRRTSRIETITAKTGSTGALVFVSVRHLIETGGRCVVNERQDIVYRDADRSPPARTAAQATPGRHCVEIVPTPVMLFRYSALTFNGHRIHYDRTYAVEIEHYPGLVFHGPLQATLLLRYATSLSGRSPDRFAYRGLSPLFDTEPFLLSADPAVDGIMTLHTARHGGPVAMSAQARWSA